VMEKEENQVGILLDKLWIDKQFETLPSWKQITYKYFTSMVADESNTYPCIPARQGFLTNHLRFSFVRDPRELNSAKELAEALREYGKCSRDTGKYASLVVFFEPSHDLLEI